MRNHELRKIRLKDFENREGVKVLRYVGLGQKVNQVPIHPVTGYHLGQYLDYMASKGRPIGPEDYLFQASKCSEGSEGRQLSIRQVIEQKDLSRAELAMAGRISRAIAGQIHRGSADKISTDRLLRIARRLGLKPKITFSTDA